MAAQLINHINSSDARNILAVVGAGHLKGINEQLNNPQLNAVAAIESLNRLPTPSRWPKILPWAIVGLILLGFSIGFYRSRSWAGSWSWLGFD